MTPVLASYWWMQADGGRQETGVISQHDSIPLLGDSHLTDTDGNALLIHSHLTASSFIL